MANTKAMAECGRSGHGKWGNGLDKWNGKYLWDGKSGRGEWNDGLNNWLNIIGTSNVHGN